MNEDMRELIASEQGVELHDDVDMSGVSELEIYIRQTVSSNSMLNEFNRLMEMAELGEAMIWELGRYGYVSDGDKRKDIIKRFRESKVENEKR